MNPVSRVEVFQNREDGRLLILRYGISRTNKFIVGVDSFIEVTRDQTEVDAGRKILEALNGFPWPDTETHCKLSDMSAVQRRKFHKLHENVLIWKDDAAGGVLHIKATIPRGNGGIGDPTRQKLLRPPVTESEVLKAVLGVLDIPARLKGKSKRTQ